jgi:hypothetical protein
MLARMDSCRLNLARVLEVGSARKTSSPLPTDDSARGIRRRPGSKESRLLDPRVAFDATVESGQSRIRVSDVGRSPFRDLPEIGQYG